MRSCKGYCIYAFKSVYRQNNPIGFISDVGRKYCTVCSCWMIWNSIKCPCCNSTLRTVSRETKAKVNLKCID